MVSCLSLPPFGEGTGRLETVVIGRVGLAPFGEGTGRLEAAVVSREGTGWLESAVIGCVSLTPFGEGTGRLESRRGRLYHCATCTKNWRPRVHDACCSIYTNACILLSPVQDISRLSVVGMHMRMWKGWEAWINSFFCCSPCTGHVHDCRQCGVVATKSLRCGRLDSGG